MKKLAILAIFLFGCSTKQEINVSKVPDYHRMKLSQKNECGNVRETCQGYLLSAKDGLCYCRHQHCTMDKHFKQTCIDLKRKKK